LRFTLLLSLQQSDKQDKGARALNTPTLCGRVAKQMARLDAPVFTGGGRLQDEKCVVSLFELQSCQEWATCYTTPSGLASLTRAQLVVSCPLSTETKESFSGNEGEP
jgi:hypothetical protein